MKNIVYLFFVLFSCFSCSEKPITVHLKGGTLQIFWDEKEGNAFMSGPASYVFEIHDLQL